MGVSKTTETVSTKSLDPLDGTGDTGNNGSAGETTTPAVVKTFSGTNGLTSQGAGALHVAIISDDGKVSKAARSFANFLLSIEPSTASSDDAFTVGTDSDITLTSSETKSYSVTVNGFNPAFHSLVTGATYKDTSAGDQIIGMKNVTFKPVTDTTDSAIATYTLTDENPTPCNDEEGLFTMFVTDAIGGHSWTMVDTIAEIAYNTFHYDQSTKVLSVSSDNNGKDFSLEYRYLVDVGISISDASIVTRPELKLVGRSHMMEVKGSRKYDRVQIMTRAKLTGDYSDAVIQRAPENNITYTFEIQSVLEGQNKWLDNIYEVTS